MRILFTTQPAYGHFLPLVPFAAAARDAGHEVRFATGARFGEVVRSTGFEARPTGLDWLEADKSGMPAERRPAPGSTIEEYFAQQFVTATAEDLAADVIALADHWRPDVIVRERTEFGGAIAAEALGVAGAAVQIGSPGLFTSAQLDALDAPYERARLAVGLAPGVRRRLLDAQTVLTTAPLDFHDPGLPASGPLVALRPTTLDRAPDDVLPEWAAALGTLRPVVYATLGTVFNNPAFDLPFFPAVVSALGDRDLDLVITLGPNGDPSTLDTQSSNIHVHRFVPQSLLFPRCDAVVCHGGFGTLMAAIEHAVPIVVVPFGADQYLNAASVERLGIGVVVDGDDVTAETIARSVDLVLGDSPARRRILEVRDATRHLPPVAHAVTVLEHLVAATAG